MPVPGGDGVRVEGHGVLRPPGYPPLSLLRTASCSSPVGGHDVAAVRPGRPSRLVNAPPASRTRMSSAARSHRIHLGFGGDVDGALGEQAVGQEVAVGRTRHTVSVSSMKRSRRPSFAQPDRLENDRLADSRSATEDTDTRRAGPPAKDANAPSPAPAHQRRCNAGALTTPATGTPSCNSAINVAHTGTPRTKFLVPSIGSITHCLPRKSCSAELLTEHRVIGPLLRQGVAQCGLHRAVRVGDRGEVRLGVDVKVQRAEAFHRQRVGLVGQLQGQAPRRLGRCSWRAVLPWRCVGIRGGAGVARGVGALAAPWIMRRRGTGSDWVRGTMVVTGVSPRPDRPHRANSSSRSPASSTGRRSTNTSSINASPSTSTSGRRWASCSTSCTRRRIPTTGHSPRRIRPRRAFAAPRAQNTVERGETHVGRVRRY